MFWAMIVAFVGAAVLLILTGLGILHANRVSAEERLFEELKDTDSTTTPEHVA
jgi:hypothetical protein